MQHNRTAED